MIYLVPRDYIKELKFENFMACYDSLSAVPLLQKNVRKTYSWIHCELQYTDDEKPINLKYACYWLLAPCRKAITNMKLHLYDMKEKFRSLI